jgi:hypothetical protein
MNLPRRGARPVENDCHRPAGGLVHFVACALAASAFRASSLRGPGGEDLVNP